MKNAYPFTPLALLASLLWLMAACAQPQTCDLAQYGLLPDSGNDCAPLMQKGTAIASCWSV